MKQSDDIARPSDYIGTYQDVFDDYFMVRIKSRIETILEEKKKIQEYDDEIDKIEKTEPGRNFFFQQRSKPSLLPFFQKMETSVGELRKQFVELRTDCFVFIIFVDKFLVGDSTRYPSNIQYQNKKFKDDIPDNSVDPEDYLNVRKPLNDSLKRIEESIKKIGTVLIDYKNACILYIDDPIRSSSQLIQTKFSSLVDLRNLIKSNFKFMLTIVYHEMKRKHKMFEERIKDTTYMQKREINNIKRM